MYSNWKKKSASTRNNPCLITCKTQKRQTHLGLGTRGGFTTRDALVIRLVTR